MNTKLKEFCKNGHLLSSTRILIGKKKDRSECGICRDLRNIKSRENNPETYINTHLKRKYNIDLNQYKELCAQQEYMCKICLAKFDFNKELPCVDHDHLTKEVRGILCRKCNSGLGFFNDDAGLLFSASKYLSKNK